MTIPDNQGGGNLEDLKIRVTQPSLAITGADLGNSTHQDNYFPTENLMVLTLL